MFLLHYRDDRLCEAWKLITNMVGSVCLVSIRAQYVNYRFSLTHLLNYSIVRTQQFVNVSAPFVC